MVDRGTFYRQVRDLLEHLDDRPYLARHPLTTLLSENGKGTSPESVRHVLLGVIGEVRPPDGASPGSIIWRRWKCLSMRYADGATTKQIARELRVSDRQALRDHLLGIKAIADVLWTRFGAKEELAPPDAGRLECPRDGTSAPHSETSEDLETELARMAALPSVEATELGDVLDGAIATIQNLAEGREARFEVSSPRDLRSVTISSVALRQVLLCLLTASTLRGSAVQVELDPTNARDCVDIVFSSRSKSAHHAIRLNGPDDEPLIGTARRLVQPEGGSVVVENREDGTRSLILMLPTAPTIKLLVIDDNPDMGELFRWYLAGRNYYVVQARTPPSALELARTLQPDVITLDVIMPAQDGWQILQQLRREPATQKIPVIVCSVIPERQIAESFGVADFLAKPITQPSLLAALADCLGTKAASTYPDQLSSTASSRLQ